MASQPKHEPVRGIRASKLDDILDRSVKQTVRACAYEKLASCFPTLAQNDPDTLRHAQTQVVAFLTSACRSEFDKILAERHAIPRLNDLDALLADARTRKESGAPAGENPSGLSPEVILRAHMVPRKRAELAEMEGRLQDLQKRNAERLALVEHQRSQIEIRTRALKESLATLDLVVSTATSTAAKSIQA